jgi:hypothetical protein
MNTICFCMEWRIQAFIVAGNKNCFRLGIMEHDSGFGLIGTEGCWIR